MATEPIVPITKDTKLRNSPIFKLKDKPGRDFIGINFKEWLGFLPEMIVIEKVKGLTNGIVIRAVLTDEQMEKEKALDQEVINKAQEILNQTKKTP